MDYLLNIWHSKRFSESYESYQPGLVLASFCNILAF